MASNTLFGDEKPFSTTTFAPLSFSCVICGVRSTAVGEYVTESETCSPAAFAICTVSCEYSSATGVPSVITPRSLSPCALM
jgi:hypothetical protein